MPLDAEGRSTGFIACVTAGSLRPSGSSPVPESARNRLSGYDEAQKYAKDEMGLVPSKVINACHLFGDSLGESGADQRNLATCFRGVNAFDNSAGGHGSNNFAAMEGQVRNAARNGQSVLYTVNTMYASPSSKVPYQFDLAARGSYNGGLPGIEKLMKIDNSYGPGGVNLGYVIQ